MNAKNLITLVVLFLPVLAFGDDSTESSQAQLISAAQTLTTLIGFLIGLIVFINGWYKLSQVYNEGQKNTLVGPVVYVIAGVLMMNVFLTLDVFTYTFFKVDNYCQIIKDEAVVQSCMSDAMSGLTGELKTRIEKMSSEGTAQAFLDHISVIVGSFQLIGFIYMLSGFYGLTQVANGSAKNGYGKPIITIFASALIVDIPHTAQMAIATLAKIGLNF
jgi:uncharacterized membrane protein